ncbi:MAG: hypothetical protein U5K35_06800 [Rhodohalobacter sp.]|nr:hypothetical protein [Rhodohalobacter sp.]
MCRAKESYGGVKAALQKLKLIHIKVDVQWYLRGRNHLHQVEDRFRIALPPDGSIR